MTDHYIPQVGDYVDNACVPTDGGPVLHRAGIVRAIDPDNPTRAYVTGASFGGWYTTVSEEMWIQKVEPTDEHRVLDERGY